MIVCIHARCSLCKSSQLYAESEFIANFDLLSFDLALCFLQIRVFDKDEVTDDSLGLVDVDLSENDFSSGGASHFACGCGRRDACACAYKSVRLQ